MANEFAPLEGRSFIIGRGGHVLVDDPSVSGEHAEISFDGGRILLRDLDSTNGLYLITDKGPRRFREGYVLPQQTVAFGSRKTSVQSLLDTIFSLTF